VINHGVPDEVRRDMEAVCQEFFAMPAADRESFYSDDNNKPNRFFSGSTYKTGGAKFWFDCLRLSSTFPIGDSKNEWPEKPQKLR
jgi:2'-deoxymugineic-acid 2'-dioxygenase/mugineic-acid 3-dioxygenase